MIDKQEIDLRQPNVLRDELTVRLRPGSTGQDSLELITNEQSRSVASYQTLISHRRMSSLCNTVLLFNQQPRFLQKLMDSQKRGSEYQLPKYSRFVITVPTRYNIFFDKKKSLPMQMEPFQSNIPHSNLF